MRRGRPAGRLNISWDRCARSRSMVRPPAPRRRPSSYPNARRPRHEGSQDGVRVPDLRQEGLDRQAALPFAPPVEQALEAQCPARHRLHRRAHRQGQRLHRVHQGRQDHPPADEGLTAPARSRIARSAPYLGGGASSCIALLGRVGPIRPVAATTDSLPSLAGTVEEPRHDRGLHLGADRARQGR